MAIKSKNKIVPITCTPYHLKKLEILCNRSGLSKTEVVQRLIEQAPLMFSEMESLGQEK